MKSVNYQNTELKVVSIADLDGGVAVEPQERNILREKTFNSELNMLVNKIFSNEKQVETAPEHEDEFKSIEKNSLLQKCEKIIYMLKHEDDLATISSAYNPFDADINVYDYIDDTADYIKAGLHQCGFTKYQILKYNFNDKAYRGDINLLDESYSSDMYFSINDPVISHINRYREGFIIRPELINSDPFFLKKFLNDEAESNSNSSYYLIKTSSLFHKSETFSTFGSRVNQFEEFLSPLLLIEIDSDRNLKTGDIFKLLQENTAIPLMVYFLKNRIRYSLKNYSYENTLLMIETFIQSAVNTNLKSYLITLDDYSSKNNIFILKFFLSKIRKILKRNSLILRITINRAVLITSAQDLGAINNIIDKINTGSEIIQIQPVDYNEYLNSKEFVNLFL